MSSNFAWESYLLNFGGGGSQFPHLKNKEAGRQTLSFFPAPAFCNSRLSLKLPGKSHLYKANALVATSSYSSSQPVGRHPCESRTTLSEGSPLKRGKHEYFTLQFITVETLQL